MNNVNIILKNVSVQNVNMLNGLLVAGFPSICSFVGFANALAFYYQHNKAKIAIINNGMNYLGDMEWRLMRRFKINGVDQPTCRSEINKKTIALSGQAHCLGTLNCSLYISIYTNDAEKLHTKINEDIESGKLSHLLKTKFKLCGGNIINIDDILLKENIIDDLKQEKNFFVLDRKDLLSNSSNILEDCVDLIYKSKQKDSEFIHLNNVGYSLLTDLKEKKNVRNNKKHAFVEPVFGFVEYKKVRDITNLDNVFWNFTKKDNAYICENVNNYENEIDF